MPRIAEGQITHISGVPPQMDDVDKLAVSCYGENVAPGDSPLLQDPVYGLRIAPHAAGWAFVDGNANNPEIMYSHDGVRMMSAVYNMRSNGATWDRARNNWTSVILPSAPRGATVQSADQVNFDHAHLILFLHITVQTAAETIQLGIHMEDPISGQYFTIWTAAAAIGAVGIYTYCLANANAGALFTEDMEVAIPRMWRLNATQVGVGPLTYSVSASYVHH